MSELPKLDRRSFEDLLSEVEFLAKQYTPEWNFDKNSSDFGVVFAKTFCKMTEDTISKYNKTVYNYYLTFLNMLGTRLRPSYPSSGMVVVKASANNSDGVYIDKGERLFASADTEDGTVVYETVDPLTAIDTTIEKIYVVDGKNDFISTVYENKYEAEEKIKPFRIFDNVLTNNLQAYEIYFYDDTLFDMSKTDVVFSFCNSLSAESQKNLPKIFSDTENVIWECMGKNGEWVKAESVCEKDGLVRVTFSGKAEKGTLLETESRFIRCKFKSIPKDSISVTSIDYHTISEKLVPENYVANESELSANDFFPFEEKYNMYNAFYIKSDEVFNKKGAKVKLAVDLQFVKIETDATVPGTIYKSIMNESDFASMKPGDIKIEAVKWEYWNGQGWAKLKTLENSDDFFSVTEETDVHRELSFVCPDDMESISIGPTSGYFIRARISKMNDRFEIYANYITPYIHSAELEYSYGENEHKFSSVMVNSDLKTKVVNLSDKGLTTLLEKTIDEEPAMYLRLENPLVQGVIRVFIDIEEGIHRFNPSVKWEYLAEDHKGGAKWKHIDVMDATDDFAHSGTITMIGKNDFYKAEIFGEEGYFIRVVNPDGKYSNGEMIAARPIINDIQFNAVKVIQKDTKEPEYFSIEKNEENKLCELSFNNIASAEVWVDEIGEISSWEQEKFLKSRSSDVQAEYDELGKLEHLWIKWKPVANLVSYGADDRVYEIDYPKGEVLFGDGRKGKIPPEQYSESIKIEYSVCNGTKGNIPAGEIKDFVSTLSNVESVTNPSAIMGGVDKETIDSAASRMFSQISGGNRLVSLSDFEESICFNDRNIYKVRCLPHVDEDGNECIGATSIAVLPRVYMQGYEKFQGIKNKIWEFMDDKAPATLAKSTRLGIFEVGYVETCVSVDVVIEDFNQYQGVYSGIESRLEKFLDPVKGNFSGKGWEIGQFPRKEFIYNYIKVVPNIKWIKSINIFTNLVTPNGKQEIDFEEVKKKKFVVPVYGTPEINIEVG